jgi:hypothetical protein
LTRAAAADQLDLWYLDEAGFAPTLPTGYTWARRGVRPLVPYEAPKGRRLNALGALAPCGPVPRLVFHTRLGKLDGPAFLDFICHQVAGLPPAPDWVPADYRRTRPCVIVLDNYSVHHSAVVKAVRPRLERAGVRLYFLPPYSPELNRIEPEWRAVKYEGLPTRSYTSGPALKAAVDAALLARSAHHRVTAVSTTYLCKAA